MFPLPARILHDTRTSGKQFPKTAHSAENSRRYSFITVGNFASRVIVGTSLSDEVELVRRVRLRLLPEFAASSLGAAAGPIEAKGKEEAEAADQVLAHP